MLFQGQADIYINHQLPLAVALTREHSPVAAPLADELLELGQGD